MSAETAPPPVDPVDAAPKPLINPLQTDAPPPSSTVVEPPRSPKQDVPVPVVAEQPEPLPQAAAVVGGVDGEVAGEVAAQPVPVVAVEQTQPVAEVAVASEAAYQPERELAAPAPADPVPVSIPTPVPPISTSASPAPPPPQAMEVDAPGEDVPIDTPSSLGIKRSGDNLASEDSKRVKPLSPDLSPNPIADTHSTHPTHPHPHPTPSAPAVPGAPVVGPVDPAAPNVVYPWTNFVPTSFGDPGPTSPLTLSQHKHLLGAVRSLKKSKDAINFVHPVDVVLFNIPHYPQIIDRPMDLTTIETKLVASDPRGPPKDRSKAAKWDTSKGQYSNTAEVTSDVRQMWENTRKFNGREHVVSYAATKLDQTWERALKTLPSDQPLTPSVASPADPLAAAGGRRMSLSQTPVIRRDADSSRPKRDIHPPPSKDINYDSPGALRKPKRRTDPQLQWAARTIASFEKSQKYLHIVSHFFYPVEEIIRLLPQYNVLIKKPIDLLMIKQRLEDNVYEDVDQIDADIRLLVNNARKFNPPEDDVHRAAVSLLQLWEEKWATLPPKQLPRDPSEDAIGDDFYESDDDDKDVVRLRQAKAERAALEREIADLESRIARKPKRKPAKAPKPKPAPRKYSTSKPSPGANGVAKKPRKSKEASYRDDDDDDDDSDDELSSITIAQKQELAEKINTADAHILTAAIEIIQSTTHIAGDQEIELDIDSLPADTVLRLYNLVCRGRKRGPKKPKPQPRKSGFGGAPGRKHLNEQEEADRIRKMEAKLQSFEGRGAANAYDEEDSSSEEESSDDE